MTRWMLARRTLSMSRHRLWRARAPSLMTEDTIAAKKPDANNITIGRAHQIACWHLQQCYWLVPGINESACLPVRNKLVLWTDRDAGIVACVNNVTARGEPGITASTGARCGGFGYNAKNTTDCGYQPVTPWRDRVRHRPGLRNGHEPGRTYQDILSDSYSQADSFVAGRNWALAALLVQEKHPHTKTGIPLEKIRWDFTDITSHGTFTYPRFLHTFPRGWSMHLKGAEHH
jgi:hypothetical protein